jgi:hypothetical protein
LVANAQIVLGSYKKKFRFTPYVTIRHQDQIDGEPPKVTAC